MTKKRHKSFGTPVQDVEPLTFDLHDEEFEAYPQIQGATLLEFSKQASSADGAEAAEALIDIFKKVLKPESAERFEALTHDPERIVTVETLGEIVGFLVGEYTSRPTTPSAKS